MGRPPSRRCWCCTGPWTRPYRRAVWRRGATWRTPPTSASCSVLTTWSGASTGVGRRSAWGRTSIRSGRSTCTWPTRSRRSVDLLQRCYSGLEARQGVLRFEPFLPRDLPRLHFHMQYRNNWLEVDVERERLTLYAQPSSASPVTVAVRGDERTVAPGSRIEFELGSS
ncbi:MAG: glycosyl hydrolase family 65 protein [Gemmatimonadota bacterium]